MSNLRTPSTEDTPEFWLASLGSAQPLYSSLPTPGAKNELEACEKVAGALGLKLLPWQRYFLRVTTEMKPNGDYRYSSALLTVSRQAGKSTVLQVLAITRALLYPNVNVFYTAQTSLDAYSAIILGLGDAVEKSVFGKTVSVRRSNQSPGIKFANGSMVASFNPSPSGLHGKTRAKTIILDEIFKWSQTEGDLLQGAAAPTTLVLGGKAQTLMMSTKGTAQSEFLNGKIQKGRRDATNPDATAAYFEWAMAPGLDPMDLSNYSFHPGLAAGLITQETIAKMADELSPGEFKRAMANVYTETSESVFDLKHWETLKAALHVPKASEVAYGYEVNASRTAAAICAAWKAPDGSVHLKLIRNDPSTQWLLDDIPKLNMTKPLAIGADKHAQSNVITDQLSYNYPDLELYQLTATEFGTASAAFRARVEEGTLHHDGSPALYRAIQGAVTRSFGDSGFAFSHNSSPELIAAIVAVRLIDQTKRIPAPFIAFAD